MDIMGEEVTAASVKAMSVEDFDHLVARAKMHDDPDLLTALIKARGSKAAAATDEEGE